MIKIFPDAIYINIVKLQYKNILPNTAILIILSNSNFYISKIKLTRLIKRILTKFQPNLTFFTTLFVQK